MLSGKYFKKAASHLVWPGGKHVEIHCLAWKRREIENYLLSYTALNQKGLIDKVNNDEIALKHHLAVDYNGDNDSIRRLRAKPVVDPLFDIEGVGVSEDKLQAYIDLIPPTEISEDITNMYHFIVKKLEEYDAKANT